MLQSFATSNLLTLYGIHQRFLNNLVGRYDEQLIDDFYRSVCWVHRIFANSCLLRDTPTLVLNIFYVSSVKSLSLNVMYSTLHFDIVCFTMIICLAL